jgi:hypothetical protein
MNTSITNARARHPTFIICQLILIHCALPPIQASIKVTIVLLNHNLCLDVLVVVLPIKSLPGAHIHFAERLTVVLVVGVDRSAPVKSQVVCSEFGQPFRTNFDMEGLMFAYRVFR